MAVFLFISQGIYLKSGGQNEKTNFMYMFDGSTAHFSDRVQRGGYTDAAFRHL